jgi:trans-aconitate methyltransferase
MEQDYWKAEEYYQNSSSQKSAATDLMRYVIIHESDKILDVGCGDGKITAELANKVPHGSIIGVDISPAMIEFAKEAFPQKKFSNLQFLLKDAQALDFNDDEFNIIFSFTAIQWVQNHNAFLERAHKSLKPSGILAITMPMGLPATIEQAVNELIAMPEWSPYFFEFATGWNFVDEQTYKNLLLQNHFAISRIAVVPQKDVFPSRELFEKFIRQWFPYLRALPENLKDAFLKQVIDRFLELDSFPNGEVHFKIRRLEVVAVK